MSRMYVALPNLLTTRGGLFQGPRSTRSGFAVVGIRAGRDLDHRTEGFRGDEYTLFGGVMRCCATPTIILGYHGALEGQR